jgi:L-seryl-tRNA(Ser) seleniumtransferase/D-glucosaminate-6-phosphate ammonia-lyase
MSFYQKLGLKRIINAAGKMTALGGSAVSPEVAQALSEAAQAHVELETLMVKSGEYIAKILGGEGAVVTTGAAGGVCIATAAAVAGKDYAKIQNLPLSSGKNQIVIMKGHCVNFGGPITSMIRLGGGVPVEVGQVNSCLPEHIKGAFNENTAAFMYVKSHHAVQKGLVSIEDCVKLAHDFGVPMIVDAAAEEDLWAYPKMGIDLTCFSGSKAILGPTSGIIVGRKDLTDACRLQYHGIGRPMKVGKEGIVGIIAALEAYGGTTPERTAALKAKAEYVAAELKGIPGVSVAVVQDEAGRAIFRTEVTIDAKAAGLTATQVGKLLSSGDPAIYTRNHYANVGIILVDPRPLAEGEEKIVASRLKEIFAKKK